MRFALVDAKFPNATVNTVATYTPYASTAYGLASLAFNNRVGYFGGTETADGYATDATNDGLLWDHAFRPGRTSWPRGCKSSAPAGDNLLSPATILELPFSHGTVTGRASYRPATLSKCAGRERDPPSAC
jgi:hypothetical protein